MLASDPLTWLARLLALVTVTEGKRRVISVCTARTSAELAAAT